MKRVKLSPESKFGDTKVIEKFAFLPITIHTDKLKETRWLEHVKIEYEYNLEHTYNSCGKVIGYSVGWNKKRFLDE